MKWALDIQPVSFLKVELEREAADVTNDLNRLRSLMVADVMAKTVVWVTTQQHMSDVATVLLHHEISSAPVVDESGVCVGIVSATDFLKRDANVSGSTRRGWTPEDVAGTYMSTGVQTIPASASILQASRIMCSQHVHQLPVVNHEGRPVGVISTMDLIAALNNAIDEISAS